jgi:hypothetical protein
VQRYVHDNFGAALIDVEIGAVVVVFVANSSNSRPTDAVQDSISIGKEICLGGIGSKFKRMEAATALKTLDIGLPRSELHFRL